jgi:hypothetical protein
LVGGDSIRAAHAVKVVLNGITNPGTMSANVTLSVATTSDPSAATSGPYAIGVGPPPPVTAPPVPNTGPPTATGSKNAGFSGTVNPEGLQTTAHFAYGLDAKYRAPGDTVIYDQATPEQPVGSDSSSHAVSASVTGLVPNALYHVKLVATNSDGTISGQDQTFMTASDPTPPVPVLGKTVNVAPVSGTVFVKLPGASAAADRGLMKGVGFTPLTEARQLPSGTQVDSRFGFLKLIAAAAASQHIGKTQSVTLGGGLYKLSQARTGITKGLTTFSLLEGDFAGARPTPAAAIRRPTARSRMPRSAAASCRPCTRVGMAGSGRGAATAPALCVARSGIRPTAATALSRSCAAARST